MTNPIDVSLRSVTSWLISASSISRTACGSTIRRMVLELREADRQRGVGLPPGGSETNPGQISSLITELLYRAIPSVGVQTVETVTPSAGAYQVTFRLTDYVRPVLRERVVQTGETAAFYVREGHRRICLYRHSSRQTFRHNVERVRSCPWIAAPPPASVTRMG